MRVLGRYLYFTAALLLLAIPAVSTAQERAAAPVTEQQAAVLLAEGDWQERNEAVWLVTKLGAEVSPELRLAVINAAWAELRGETDTPPESEAIFTYLDAVAKLGDPRTIPFLIEVLKYGAGASNALADFGAAAFPAVLEAVSDPDEDQSRVSGALTALRFMLEDGTLTAGQANQVRAVVQPRLSGSQRAIVVDAAVRLALTLKDPELRGIVERLADDRSFAETLVSPYVSDGVTRSRYYAQSVNSVQEYARTFLDGGGADIGPFRRRMAVTIH